MNKSEKAFLEKGYTYFKEFAIAHGISEKVTEGDYCAHLNRCSECIFNYLDYKCVGMPSDTKSILDYYERLKEDHPELLI